jgi:hypothetical protein
MFCSDHRILIIIQPKRGLAVVLDSGDYPHDKYSEFIEILHKLSDIITVLLIYRKINMKVFKLTFYTCFEQRLLV